MTILHGDRRRDEEHVRQLIDQAAECSTPEGAAAFLDGARAALLETLARLRRNPEMQGEADELGRLLGVFIDLTSGERAR